MADCAKPKIGGLPCAAMETAFIKCTGTNPGGLLRCLGETLHVGRPTAAKAFLDFNVCAMTQCTKPCDEGGVTCTGCLKSKCKKPWNACGIKG